MNLEIQGHTITLGPKALAFIETAYRAKGEYLDQCAAIYCHDQLALWLAGGKCDPDVTVEGPARFVAKGNEIGIPMMPKAGAAICEEPSRMSQAEPMAAAPADPVWPKFALATATDNGEQHLAVYYAARSRTVYYDDGTAVTKPDCKIPFNSAEWNSAIARNGGTVAIITPAEAANWLRTNGHAKVADELERQAPPVTGLQVWRDTVRRDELLFVHSNGRIVAIRSQGAWSRWRGSPYNILPTDTRLPEPEEAREIEAAKKAGVL